MRVWTRHQGLSWGGAVTFKCDFQVLNREWCRVVCMATPPCRFLSFLAISNPEVRISDFRISRECQVSVTISMLYGLFEQRALSRSILGSPVKVIYACPKCDQEALPFYDTTFLSSTESCSHSSQMITPKNNSLRILSFIAMIQPGFNVG